MKTIAQALWDEIPAAALLGIGYIENKLLLRGLDGDAPISYEIMHCPEFWGSVADCLCELVTSPNISEADKSISLPDRDVILKKANNLYNLIGETDKISGEPTVKFGW
ncbi:MAG: hypothetical protein NC548_31855 [Lachnospiraceae bacterium]|nr:hypothetical protein [Lachnospiraceae bacterium]